MHFPILASNYKDRLRSHVRDVFFIDQETQIQLMKSTSWADGLRGLATIGVVASHLTLCFARSLLRPCCSSDEATPKIFQLPIFRLVAAGHSWVAVFFLLMGFVNSLKPLKLAQTNRHDEALANLANSSLKRVFRLVLPATLTTIIAWFLCQLQFMERAASSDAWWLYTFTPNPSSNFRWAINDLATSIRYTWLYHEGDNIYSQPQWTMFPLLHGSLVLLLALLFTINLTPKYRNVVLGIAAIWSINLSGALRDPLVGLTTLTGIILSNISTNSTTLPTLPVKNPISTRLASLLLLTTGLILMSSPSSLPESAPWSKTLNTYAQTYLPYPTRIETFRFIGSIGAILFVSGILISPVARNILSIKPLTYLGRISFPVFLLHATFMQTVMPWFAFQNTMREYESDPRVVNDLGVTEMVLRHPQRGPLGIWAGIFVAMGLCLVASYFWVEMIEPIFARITAWCEGIMMGSGSKAEGQRGGRSRLGKGGFGGDAGGMHKIMTATGDVHNRNGVLTPPRDRSTTPTPTRTLLESSILFDREKAVGRMV